MQVNTEPVRMAAFILLLFTLLAGIGVFVWYYSSLKDKAFRQNAISLLVCNVLVCITSLISVFPIVIVENEYTVPGGVILGFFRATMVQLASLVIALLGLDIAGRLVFLNSQQSTKIIKVLRIMSIIFAFGSPLFRGYWTILKLTGDIELLKSQWTPFFRGALFFFDCFFIWAFVLQTSSIFALSWKIYKVYFGSRASSAESGFDSELRQHLIKRQIMIIAVVVFIIVCYIPILYCMLYRIVYIATALGAMHMFGSLLLFGLLKGTIEGQPQRIQSTNSLNVSHQKIVV